MYRSPNSSPSSPTSPAQAARMTQQQYYLHQQQLLQQEQREQAAERRMAASMPSPISPHLYQQQPASQYQSSAYQDQRSPQAQRQPSPVSRPQGAHGVSRPRSSSYGQAIQPQYGYRDQPPSPLPSSMRSGLAASPYENAARQSPYPMQQQRYSPHHSQHQSFSSQHPNSPPPVPDYHEPYIPVFDDRRRTPVGGQQIGFNDIRMTTPTPISPARLQEQLRQQQLQQQQQQQEQEHMQNTVNDVARSRFSSFIPVSVLTLDNNRQLVVTSPHADTNGSALHVNELESPSLQSPHQQQSQPPQQQASSPHTPQILGVTRRTPSRRQSGADENNVYMFGDEDDEPVMLHAPPIPTYPSGLGTGATSPTAAGTASLNTTATTAIAAPSPTSPTGASSLGSTQTTLPVYPPSLMISPFSHHHNDMNDITLKIGSCCEAPPTYLLMGNAFLLFLMLLFVLISFGVTWSTATSNTTDYTNEFYIGHYKEYTNTSIITEDYTSATDWRQQCKIDNIRVPVCLGLSIPFPFLIFYFMWKRRQDHFDPNMRRGAILCLLIFGAWMFMACAFWWSVEKANEHDRLGCDSIS